jgi:hypothetical protein
LLFSNSCFAQSTKVWCLDNSIYRSGRNSCSVKGKGEYMKEGVKSQCNLYKW